MKMNNEERIIDLLEKILRVVSLQVGEEKSITERANLLKHTGLDNKTISQVLNTTDATVRALISQSRRKG